MRIRTFSIVAGSGSCDAHCPFCVSRMTGRNPGKAPDINWKRFDRACLLAERAGCTTAMITGKGEPTLFPGQVLEIIERVQARFPLVELQTNGIRIAQNRVVDMVRDDVEDWLFAWHHAGLSTVGVSVVHYEQEHNIPIYAPKTRKHFDLADLIKKIHSYGLSVRICCVMLRGVMDKWAGEMRGEQFHPGIREFVGWAFRHAVEQLTFTPVSMPAGGCVDRIAEEYTRKAIISPIDFKNIEIHMDDAYQHILTLPHGAKVYNAGSKEAGGQNVCLNNCLDPEPEDLDSLRNLIFMPDGHLYYKWDCEGAIIV